MDVTGLVLAAHAPALGIPAAVATLQDAGCREVIVVVGENADAVAGQVPRGALAVVATDWESGVAAVLKVGLAAASTSSADAVLIAPEGLLQLSAATARAVIEAGIADPRDTLARAHYGEQADYPVLIGRNHWGDLGDQATGDSAEHHYLDSHLTVAVDCTNLR